MLHTLDRLKPSKPGQPARAAAEDGRALRRAAACWCSISDFYEEPDAVLEAVAPLRFRGNDIIVFHVLDPAELDFTFDQASAFEDLESGEQIPVVPEALAEQYRALVRAHIDALRAKFSGSCASTTRCSTPSTPLDHALFSYLSIARAADAGSR